MKGPERCLKIAVVYAIVLPTGAAQTCDGISFSKDICKPIGREISSCPEPLPLDSATCGPVLSRALICPYRDDFDDLVRNLVIEIALYLSQHMNRSG